MAAMFLSYAFGRNNGLLRNVIRCQAPPRYCLGIASVRATRETMLEHMRNEHCGWMLAVPPASDYPLCLPCSVHIVACNVPSLVSGFLAEDG
jgi:hypothetical protein